MLNGGKGGMSHIYTFSHNLSVFLMQVLVLLFELWEAVPTVATTRMHVGTLVGVDYEMLTLRKSETYKKQTTMFTAALC